MYHPDAMLTVAHTREAELIREAEACGIPQAEGRAPNLTRLMLIVTALAILATAFWVFVG
ncbi:MAG: hypothetical protein ACT4QE_16980 [Anaerolineales bacterium]